MRRVLLLAVVLTTVLPGTASAGRWLPSEQLGDRLNRPPRATAGRFSVFVTGDRGGPLALHRGDPDLPPSDPGIAIPGSDGAFDSAVAVDREGHVVVAWVTVHVGEGYHYAWTDGRVLASVWKLGAAPPPGPQQLDHEPQLALMGPRTAMAQGTAAVAWTRFSDYGGTDTRSEGVDVAGGRTTGALRRQPVARRPGGLVSLEAVRGRPELAWTVRRHRRATLVRRRIARGGAWQGRPRAEASFDAGSLVDYQVNARGDRLLAHRVFRRGRTTDVLARLGAPGRPLGPARRFARCYLRWTGALGVRGAVVAAYPGRRAGPSERRLRVSRGSAQRGWVRTDTLAPALSDVPAAAVDAVGTAFVAWTTRTGRRRDRIVGTVAGPGRPFGHPAPLAGPSELVYELLLDVDGTGRATARWYTDERGAERARYR